MQFEWDALKAERILRERAIDFKDLIPLFSGIRTERPSDKGGEFRWVTVGMLNGKLIAVIYTRRGDILRIITARRARKNEERTYHSHDHGRGDENTRQD
jgi:uncharacterized DUF497 family protein